MSVTPTDKTLLQQRANLRLVPSAFSMEPYANAANGLFAEAPIRFHERVSYMLLIDKQHLVEIVVLVTAEKISVAICPLGLLRLAIELVSRQLEMIDNRTDAGEIIDTKQLDGTGRAEFDRPTCAGIRFRLGNIPH